MKTSERILMVSLTLFNTHGEPNVSSVDIANELDISPGNLYYHFKGKDTIVSSLFEMYRQRMSKILLAPNKENLSMEEKAFSSYYSFREKVVKELFSEGSRQLEDLAQKDSALFFDSNELIENNPDHLFSDEVHFMDSKGYHILAEHIVRQAVKNNLISLPQTEIE